MQPVRVIAGLGNPGLRYDGTRHNIGFELVDRLAENAGAGWKLESRWSARAAAIEIAGRPILLIKPETYMNLSGRAIGAVCRFYKWHPRSVCVVVDELQLAIGRRKLSFGGSAGGHNGLASIIGLLGAEFARLRIGIGPKPDPRMELTDFVLGRFTEAERQQMDASWAGHLVAVESIVALGVQRAMTSINQRTTTNE